jgi:hypothetical protein
MGGKKSAAALQEALAAEPIPWVREAMEQAILRLK